MYDLCNALHASDLSLASQSLQYEKVGDTNKVNLKMNAESQTMSDIVNKKNGKRQNRE